MPARKRSRRVGPVLAAVLILASCGEGIPTTPDTVINDPTESLPERFKAQKPVPKPDFIKAAQSASYQQAIRDAVVLLGSQPQPLRTESENELVTGGVSFDVPQDKVEAVLRKAHTDFLARGFYLFRYDQNFKVNRQPDKIGLLPTTDFYSVMAVMETNGGNYNIGTDGVIAWMKELQAEQPFMLTGIGFDYMEGYFTGPVKDPEALARRMYQFCPDIVDQGAGSVSELARELQKGNLFFWWD